MYLQMKNCKNKEIIFFVQRKHSTLEINFTMRKTLITQHSHNTSENFIELFVQLAFPRFHVFSFSARESCGPKNFLLVFGNKSREIGRVLWSV